MSSNENAEIMRALGRIEGKLETLSDIPKRTRALERGQSWFLGAAATVSAVITFFGGKILDIF